MAISVWMRDRPQRHRLGPLPDGVELDLIPSDGPLPPAIGDAELIVAPVRRMDLLEMLGEMPRLAVVQTASAGTDWIEPWVPQHVTLCNARGTRDTAVAEWVLAAILAMEKRLGDFARRQTHHEWHPEMVSEMAGRSALIVGYGSIGQRTASMLEALGLAVQGVASMPRPGVHGVGDLAGLLPAADIVVVLVPLTPATRGMFDDRMLSLMRPGALLVNAARGPVIDTTALLEHLAGGRLRAALDVTDPEPLPSGHPLWDAPGLLLTPHLAGDSPEAEERVYELVGDQIRRYAAGAPLLNVVRDRGSNHRLVF